MTARRAAYFGLMAGVLVAAMYTGDVFYALIFAFFVALLLFALAHVLYTAASFRFEQSLSSSEAIKGEEVELSIALHNEGVVPYARVCALYWLPDNLTGAPLHMLEGDIPARGILRVSTAFLCTYRGEYAPGLMSLRVTDLFGLIALTIPLRRYTYYKPLRLTVRPRVMSLRDDAQVALIRQGRMDAADVSAQEVSSVRDIRAFRPGDALKWVHFKLSARRRAVLVREFEGSARPKTLLLLDVHRHGREGVKALEIEDAMVEAAAALAHQLLEDRAPVRLAAYGAQRYEAQGDEPRDFGPMYAYFTLAAFDGQYELTDVLALEAHEKGQHVLLITTQLAPKLYGAMLALREAGNDVAAVVVATPSERQNGVDRIAGELSRRGVRCRAISPGEDMGAVRGVLV